MIIEAVLITFIVMAFHVVKGKAMSNMMLRAFLSIIIILPAAFIFSVLFTLPLYLVGLEDSPFAQQIAMALGLIATVPVASYVLTAQFRAGDDGRLKTVGMWAVVVGSIGFIVGIALADIYWPESDLNILMGFVTGPIGFALGALGAIFWARSKNRQND